MILIESECVPQHVWVVIHEPWSRRLIIAVLVQFQLWNAVPHILWAISAIQVQCVQLENAKVENVAVDLHTLHSDWFGQVLDIGLNESGKQNRISVSLKNQTGAPATHITLVSRK